MQLFTAFVLIFSIFSGSSFVQAKTTLTIVGKYAEAADTNLWKNVANGEAPIGLQRTVSIDNPSTALSSPYQKVFLQNKRLVVCSSDCNAAQPVPVQQGATNGEYTIDSSGNLPALKAATVYYWVNRLMDEMAKVGFKPERRLIINIEKPVTDLSSGARMENNAFFNPKNWTLTFLTSHVGWLQQAVGGQRVTAPALDPSVAMHEATHSIFEQVIGPVLNSEINGLHEAFADYFSLDILNDHRLGLIFSGGKALRKNDVALKFIQGMESHQLGNVVSAALWKIRGIINDQTLSRAIAFQTIRELGQNPYIAAGDVAKIHMKVAQARNLSASVQAQIAEVWKNTKLKFSELNISKLEIPDVYVNEGFFSMQISSQIPESISKEWSLPTQESVRLNILGEAPSELEGKVMWYDVEVEQQGKEKQRLHLLYSHTTKQIIAAFDRQNKLIELNSPTMFAALKEISEDIPEVSRWLSNGHNTYIQLRDNDGDITKIMRSYGHKNAWTTLKINGQDVQALQQSYSVRTAISFMTVMMGAFDMNTVKSMANLDSVALYAVSAEQFPTLKTTEIAEGYRLIGFASRTKTGMVKTSILTGFDVQYNVLESEGPK